MERQRRAIAVILMNVGVFSTSVEGFMISGRDKFSGENREN